MLRAEHSPRRVLRVLFSVERFHMSGPGGVSPPGGERPFSAHVLLQPACIVPAYELMDAVGGANRVWAASLVTAWMDLQSASPLAMRTGLG